MQELRNASRLVRLRIDRSAAFRGGGLIQSILFVSHRWERKECPDVEGVQLRALQDHLRSHPAIELIWFDYSCIPQKFGTNGEEEKCRSRVEELEFQLTLGVVNDLYLTANVLILLDGSYASRFWTLMEAWCAMKMVSREGVRTAEPAERRYQIMCIHNADPRFDEPKLINMLSTETPSEMHDILAKPDINITNMQDKTKLLPVVQKTNEHVTQMMSPTVQSHTL